jgi:hypothetical protein
MKTGYFKRLLLLILIFSGSYLRGQVPDSSVKYLADFDYFIEKLIETHPDPYSGFGNQIEFHRAKQILREQIKNVKDDEAFVVQLNKFVSKLKDGHTAIYKLQNNSLDERKKLPLALKASSGFIFVQNSTGDYKDLIGKPVIAINHVPVRELLEEIKFLYPSENISGLFYNLIATLENEISAKELFGNCKSLEFTFGLPLRDSIVSIPFMMDVNFLSEKSKIEISADNGLLYWTMIGDNKDIGYLEWNSMSSREMVEQVNRDAPQYTEVNLNAVYRILQKKRTGNTDTDIRNIPSVYEQFYSLINELKSRNSEYLIIDLRNNEGGMAPLIKPLLYILYGDQYLNYNSNAEYIVKLSPLYLNKIGYKDIDSYNSSNHSAFKMGDYRFSRFFNPFDADMPLSKKKETIESGYYRLGGDYIKKSILIALPKPQVIVLTSPKTFSAAYHFVYFLKCLGNTTIIGVASRQAGNTFMETTPFELPNTKLRGSISNSKQILFKSNPELGEILRPDLEMDWNAFKKFNFDTNAEILQAIEFIKSETYSTHH